MKKLGGFLFLALLLCLAFIANLFAYMALETNFFVFGLFILATLTVLGLFLYGTMLGVLFSLLVFSITLVTGLLFFHGLYPEHRLLAAALLIIGAFGYLVTFFKRACMCKKDKAMPVKAYDVPPVAVDDAPVVAPLSDEDFVEIQEIEKMVMPKKAAKKSTKKKPTKKKPKKAKKSTTKKKTTKKATTRKKSSKRARRR